MRVTQELIDKLIDYKLDKGLTNTELGDLIGISKSHVGRILKPGVIANVTDDTGERIAELLGITHTSVKISKARDVFEIIYEGDAMDPIIEKGQRLMAEPVNPTQLHDGDIVVCRWKESGSEKIAVRYYTRNANSVALGAESIKSESYKISATSILWIARVLRPLRSLKVRD